MPQAILPLFPKEITEVNIHIGFQQKDDFVYWFQGAYPIFCHHFRDEKKFRLFCSQLINNNNAKASELADALGVNREKLSRWAREDNVTKNPEQYSKKKRK
jgi:hypothetical protein